MSYAFVVPAFIAPATLLDEVEFECLRSCWVNYASSADAAEIAGVSQALADSVFRDLNDAERRSFEESLTEDDPSDWLCSMSCSEDLTDFAF